MTFAIKHLSVLAYAKGFTLWHYTSPADRLMDVGQEGFFDTASNLLSAGDMMLISAPDGGRATMVRQTGSQIATVPLG